jgi:hypothetical protein
LAQTRRGAGIREKSNQEFYKSGYTLVFGESEYTKGLTEIAERGC